MRFSLTFAVAALVSTVSASLVARQGGLPDCALKCIATANFGSCQATDNACLCKNNDFVSSSTECIVKTCMGNDLQTALDASKQLCAAVGVTLTSTPPSLATATAASSSASGTKSTASSTTSSAAASTSTNAASINGINTVAGVAALLAAIAL